MNLGHVVAVIMAVGLVVTAMIITRGISRVVNNKNFDDWFMEVKRLAPYHGFNTESISKFRRDEWMNYWGAGYAPEKAIKLKLSE